MPLLVNCYNASTRLAFYSACVDNCLSADAGCVGSCRTGVSVTALNLLEHVSTVAVPVLIVDKT
jgi:hypothetical protein